MVGVASGFGNGFQDQPGSVRVFRWNGTSWVQLGTEIVGENDLDQFGFSVSISSDGSIVAIGARNNDGNVAGAGHVRVFEWDSNSSDWTQLGSDLDGEAEGDQFGYSVSLSADGSIVVIGAPNALPIFSVGVLGKVYVYKWNKATSIWEQKGTTIYGEQLGDRFGASVSSSADGNVVLVGAPSNNGNGNVAGLVRVFNWNGSTWTIRFRLDGQAERSIWAFSFFKCRRLTCIEW